MHNLTPEAAADLFRSAGASLDEHWAVFDRTVKGLGYHRAGFLFDPSPADRDIGQEAIHRSSYPQACMDAYIHDGLVDHDPNIAHFQHGSGPRLWVTKASADMGPGEQAFQENAHGHGLIAGVCLPIADAHCTAWGGFGLNFDGSEKAHRRLFLDQAASLDVLCAAFHDAIFRKQLLAREYCLRPREQEVLRWLLTGANVNEVADRMGISYGTARNHAERARRALGARNISHAMVRAIGLGAIP